MLDRWSGILVRRPLAVLLAGLALALAAGVYGAGVFGSLSQGGFDDPDTESSRSLAVQREALGNQGVDVIAIYSSEDLRVEDPEFRERVEATLAGLPEDTTTEVVPWFAAEDPGLVSTDGHSAQVLISLAGETQDDYLESFEELEPTLAAEGLETDVAGVFATYADVNERTEEDLQRAETISLPVVAVLAILIFGSLVAASMPVLVGALAVIGALAVVRGITLFTEVSIFSVNVITLLGMGLAIDYALFVVSRFREELAKRPVDDPDGVSEALTTTMRTAGRTVLFSGLTVAAAMSSLLVFPQAFLRSMGYGGIAAVLVAMLAALTVLPATLRLLGRRIDKGRVMRRARARAGVDDANGAWARIAAAVMRRPVTVLVVVTAGLLFLAAPFLGVKWGSVDHRILPPDSDAYVAAEKLATDFGPETSTATVVLDGTAEQDVVAYTRDLAAVDGITGVQPVAAEGDVTMLRASWEGSSQSQASQDTVVDIRAVEPASGESLVGGLTADTVDLGASVSDHLPWMALVVVVVMMVLLFLAFGSLVLPVKAILMNALSITASFGVVTWIFSDGNLEGLLDFSSQGFLDMTNPILMLAILFGLSMDYEVFLLSRVREEWDRTGDNDAAVAMGVQKTGRIITSAALLLAVVIGAFSFSGVLFMKMIGVGMLVALLIDATVVRALLVPATMKLLGEWNWWAPGPLRRWWERYGFREEPASTGEVPEAGADRDLVRADS
ncbi:MMPL family transporter [Nocardioides euryhalodurans]|uniref:MMPL family transporter n=1 Tax=Nocardioides euryhalodurans TaxID=2518370 RepID=A0A4P7GL89_9ACTN|nr:MMPL family transporter [Nocardioides euryhalodurans]QBR92693.1 MMPL family transporter [Nocardioides euryhalodurans]